MGEDVIPRGDMGNAKPSMMNRLAWAVVAKPRQEVKLSDRCTSSFPSAGREASQVGDIAVASISATTRLPDASPPRPMPLLKEAVQLQWQVSSSRSFGSLSSMTDEDD